MDNSKMNFGDGREVKLFLNIEPETLTPCWACSVDDITLMATASSFYDYAKDHPIITMGSNLTNKKDFTYTQTIDNFKNAIVPGVANMFKDIVMNVKEFKVQGLAFKPSSKATNIAMFGTQPDSFISAVIENENNLIRIDGHVR